MYKFLTRQEELLLIVIWRLKENAYGMAIKAQLEEFTESKWSFGAVYAPLGRLLKKGMADSTKGEPTPERGDKSKVFYTLTTEGKKALMRVRKIHEVSWQGLPSLE